MPWCVRKINQACGHFHHGVDVRQNRNKRITKITLNDDALGISNCILKCYAGLINLKGMNGNLFSFEYENTFLNLNCVKNRVCTFLTLDNLYWNVIKWFAKNFICKLSRHWLWQRHLLILGLVTSLEKVELYEYKDLKHIRNLL